MEAELKNPEFLEALGTLLRLDKDAGYSMQISIWPTGGRFWVDDHVIHPDDLSRAKITKSIKRLAGFLDTYKTTPMIDKGVEKQRHREKRNGRKGGEAVGGRK